MPEPMTHPPSQAPDKAGVVEQRKVLARRGRELHRRVLSFATSSPAANMLLAECGEFAKAAAEALSALSPPPVVEEAGLAGKAPITSRELIIRCGGDPDTPLGKIDFPAEMRVRAPTPTAGEEEVERARRIVHDAILHFDDSQRGFNSAANALEGKNEETSLAFRCALLGLQSATPRGLTIPDELRDLSEKATEGPWIVHPIMAWISPAADLDLPICQMRVATDGESSEAQALADAPLIASSVNFIRQALAAIASPEARGKGA